MKYNSVPLGEVAEISMGSAPPGNSYNETEEGLPMIAGAGDYGEKYPCPKKWTTSPTRVTEVGDLIVCVRATIGDLNWADKQYCLGRGVAGLRAKKNLDIKYASHYINAKKNDLSKLGSGSTFLAIRRGALENFPIPLPTISEQQRIATILDKADAIRRKRKHAIKLADDFLRATFLDMFGDPVTNPKGWKVMPFGENLTSLRYGTGSPPPYQHAGIPFIRATNIKRGTIQAEGMRFITPEDSKKISKCEVNSGDLIIVRSGINTGDCALIPKQYDGAYAAYDIIMTMPYEKAIFYNYLINSSFGRHMIEPLTRRAAQPHLNADQIKGLLFITPPESIISMFCKIVLKIQGMNERNNIYQRDLGTLFNSLTQRAFRGEL